MVTESVIAETESTGSDRNGQPKLVKLSEEATNLASLRSIKRKTLFRTLQAHAKKNSIFAQVHDNSEQLIRRQR